MKYHYFFTHRITFEGYYEILKRVISHPENPIKTVFDGDRDYIRTAAYLRGEEGPNFKALVETNK